MDSEKVQAVQSWERTKCVQDPQCFLGFVKFFRLFIQGYSCICQRILKLLKKEQEWTRYEKCQKIFDQLKERFYTAPILKHFDPTLETILERNASDYIVLGILRQNYLENDKLVLHPVAYLSKNMSPAECNYRIGDTELLAIVASLET